jgi:hypothetical protein
MFLDEITPRPEATLEFFDFWFRGVSEKSLVSIVQIHPTRPQTYSYVFPLEDIQSAVQTSGLNALTWAKGETFDLYFSVATLKNKPESGRRGGLKNVKHLPGVWADFDVKDGYFESQEEILSFLNFQRIPPSAIILTGNQGAHAYWKLDEPLELEKAREMCLKWWVYQSSLAGERRIDKLVDPSRVMRLPGSVRWPKKIEQGTSVCGVQFPETQRIYTLDELESVAEESWIDFQQRNEDRRDSISRGTSEVKEFVRDLTSQIDPDNIWLQRLAMVGVEEEFNETYSWDQILAPKGWTKLSTDDEGRVFWSRPGDGLRKSATTDWPESPHVMSLFSTSPETGLLGLHESEIGLTKYRVWVQLYWGGDELAAVRAYLNIGTESL